MTFIFPYIENVIIPIEQYFVEGLNHQPDAHFSGDSDDVQDQLVNVQKLAATSKAFAAILADGSVVAWGNPILGGDVSGSVAERLQLGGGLMWFDVV